VTPSQSDIPNDLANRLTAFVISASRGGGGAKVLASRPDELAELYLAAIEAANLAGPFGPAALGLLALTDHGEARASELLSAFVEQAVALKRAVEVRARSAPDARPMLH
jgi:hypothetical protein